MKTIIIEDVIEVKVHNKREEHLVNVLSVIIESSKKYLAENTFEDNTLFVIRTVHVPDIKGILLSMRCLGMIDSSSCIHSIPFYKDNNLC